MSDRQDIDAELKQRLKQNLTQIVRERDPYLASGGHFLVREYIRESFAQWGDVETHEFTYKNKTHQNLILNCNARQLKWEVN